MTPPPPSQDPPNQTVTSEYVLGPIGRMLLGLWAVFLISGFALAASLEPDPRGFGTHQGLGLPPCSFRVLFGVHCPSCGSTTCFANYVRGDWIAAIRANTAAFLLAIACTGLVPWCCVGAWRGRMWRVSDPGTTLMWLLVGLCALSLLQWLMRLLWN